MLLQFSVKNFLSIKDEVVFSMQASIDNENIENVFSPNSINEKILKSTAIYGANASGKTSFVKALTAAILMIRKSNLRKINEPLLDMAPFKFDLKTKDKPCKFEFIFIADNIKHVYGFSADINRVYEEYLYQYLSAKPTKIFERTDTTKYSYLQTDKNKLEELASKNTEKKLFLATATEWNYEKTKSAYMWFAEKIDTYNEYINLSDNIVDKFEKDENNELRKFTIKLLKETDIKIKDYKFETESIKSNNFIAMINDKQIPKQNIIQKEIKISTLHEIEDENGNICEYELGLAEESLGTQNLFFFSPVLKDAFEKGRIVIIDEIDRSLHPLLVKYIINLFHNPNININNAQLIFNTHDTNLLSLDIFRRDQIWFVEKDHKKGTTGLYPLDDFSVRKTENIQKGYLNGRYGAIPFVATGNNLWGD